MARDASKDSKVEVKGNRARVSKARAGNRVVRARVARINLAAKTVAVPTAAQARESGAAIMEASATIPEAVAMVAVTTAASIQETTLRRVALPLCQTILLYPRSRPMTAACGI
jgi:hypothetical protein